LLLKKVLLNKEKKMDIVKEKKIEEKKKFKSFDRY